jgi:hypothetical protein
LYDDAEQVTRRMVQANVVPFSAAHIEAILAYLESSSASWQLEDDRAEEDFEDSEGEDGCYEPRKPASRLKILDRPEKPLLVPGADAWLQRVGKKNLIPFYTVNVIEKTGAIVSVHNERGAETTGNEARPDSVDSIYLSYAMVILKQTP